MTVVPPYVCSAAAAHGRAGTLGGEARCLLHLPGRAQAARSSTACAERALHLFYPMRCCPRPVIASNPSSFPGRIALLYAMLARVPMVLDSHTGKFGLKGDRVSRLLLPAHAKVARRASATLVAPDELAERVRDWGGRPQVVHEAPPRWDVAPPGPLADPPTVLMVSTFDPDGAVDHVIEAARLVPKIGFRLNGDIRKCPPEIRASLPPNIELVGFLRDGDYVRAIGEANVVVMLTTEPRSVARGGYEARRAAGARPPATPLGLPASNAGREARPPSTEAPVELEPEL